MITRVVATDIVDARKQVRDRERRMWNLSAVYVLPDQPGKRAYTFRTVTP